MGVQGVQYYESSARWESREGYESSGRWEFREYYEFSDRWEYRGQVHAVGWVGVERHV